MTLCDSDRIAEAQSAYRAALDEFDELSSTWLLGDTLLMVAIAQFHTGNWDDALAGLETGLTIGAERGQAILIGQARACQALIAVARGDTEGAEKALAPVAGALEQDVPGWGAGMIAYAAAKHAEALGNTEAAYRILRRAWEYAADRSDRYYHRAIGPELVRLALARDEVDLGSHVTELVEVGAGLAPEVATVQCAAARCRALVECSPALARKAVELGREGPRVLDAADEGIDAARVLESAGEVGDVVALLLEARDCYDRLGAYAWTAPLAAELRRLGIRRGVRGPRRRPAHGWEGLTASERLVAEHVAKGMTNRETARALHISPHTVNSHLRHAFDKLGVSPCKPGGQRCPALNAERSRIRYRVNE